MKNTRILREEKVGCQRHVNQQANPPSCIYRIGSHYPPSDKGFNTKIFARSTCTSRSIVPGSRTIGKLSPSKQCSVAGLRVAHTQAGVQLCSLLLDFPVEVSEEKNIHHNEMLKYFAEDPTCRHLL